MGKVFAGMSREMDVGLIIYVMEEYQMHPREEQKKEKWVKTMMRILSRISSYGFPLIKKETVVGRGFFTRQFVNSNVK